jgi:hypothetical protein
MRFDIYKRITADFSCGGYKVPFFTRTNVFGKIYMANLGGSL